MPTKTERIIANLPGTFQALPRPSTLFSVIDAFGGELLKGENSLAAVLLAHWVDHADRGAELIDDLARIGALYGLAPRPDESVEEFRTHLKRYIRTFIEGTVTVQGALRVAAETLALNIADQYQEMDSWWKRTEEILTTAALRGDAAAPLVLGFDQARAQGRDAHAARIEGTVALGSGIDLRGMGQLHLQLDGGATVTVDLLAGVGDSAAVTLGELVVAIDTALGVSVASQNAQRLRLLSPTSGAGSRLQIVDGPEDAATAIIGLPPRRYLGRDAAAARVTGSVDLAAGVDLSEERYLRLFIDGAHLAEIDCAGPVPAATSLDQLRDAINAVIGFVLASHDGHRLQLTSPIGGLGSRIEFKPPAAQDARGRLFGAVPALTLGSDAAAARLVGQPDLGGGIDLSDGANLALKIDGGAALTVHCAGADPARTQLPEVVTAVNAALGGAVASHNGRRLILASPSVGAAGRLEVGLAASGDASARLLGLKPRSATGGPATQAQLVGLPDLAAGVDLAALHRLPLALDDAEPVTINLRALAADRRNVTLAEMAAAINAALGASVAGHDGQHLILTSSTSGAASSLAVMALEQRTRRRFVTRTPVLDEAAPLVFGQIAAEARGAAASGAQLLGTVDLSRGVDLRAGGFLRLALDGGAPVEIDCSGPRPRATTLDQVVEEINAALPASIASRDSRHLILTSAGSGVGSRLMLAPTQARDARESLLGLQPQTAKGLAATGVVFVGTVDLMAGVSLPADARVKIGTDGAPPVEIVLSAAAETKTLNQLMLAINLGLGQTIARHDGIYLTLASPTTGTGSTIEFATPVAGDVTALVFGISGPRSYQGAEAVSARLDGVVDLSAGADLRQRRFLRLGVDGGAVREIDCGQGITDLASASLADMIAAINSQAGAAVASSAAGRVVLTSPFTGAASRLVLDPYLGGDAAAALLGAGVVEAVGRAATQAVLSGSVDLLAGVDLSQRHWLKLAVDGGRPLEIDVAGAAPGRSFGPEIVAAINRSFPGLAALSDQDQLLLTSPSTGEASQVSLLPLRYLEVIEYPPQSRDLSAELRHGQTLEIENAGAAAVFAEACFRSDRGIVGPGLADVAAGWRLRLRTVLGAGEQIRLRRDPEQGLQALRLARDGSETLLDAAQIWIEGEAAAVLQVPQGRSQWMLLNCLGSRFDSARFNHSHFTGGPCLERGVFDLSRFSGLASQEPRTVFAGADPEPATSLTLRWVEHTPGAFNLNLPLDLPPRFGGRFNHARFNLPAAEPEFYPFAVTEPLDDADYLPGLLNASSRLVSALVVASVPLGWQPVAMPFRMPRSLTLGSPTQAARLYLAEEGIQGFLQLEAKIPGAAGNSIRVAARKSGPALFDVSVSFDGGRFENARQVVLGEPLPALTEKLLQPGPVGLLQAKAAGIQVAVTRDGTKPQP